MFVGILCWVCLVVDLGLARACVCVCKGISWPDCVFFFFYHVSREKKDSSCRFGIVSHMFDIVRHAISHEWERGGLNDGLYLHFFTLVIIANLLVFFLVVIERAIILHIDMSWTESKKIFFLYFPCHDTSHSCIFTWNFFCFLPSVTLVWILWKEKESCKMIDPLQWPSYVFFLL